jgi:CCR4-NOT transcription complex subunit 6
MTYNVLAKKLATADRFHYCPEWMLSWDYRKTLLLHEITSRNADIVALQVTSL